jgi:hypothetical protein
VRQHTELKLTIVCDNELLARLCHECLSDLVLVLIKGWLILEIRLPAGDATCLSVKIHAAVDAALCIWCALERDYVRLKQGFNLLKLEPVFECQTTNLALFFLPNALKMIVCFAIGPLFRVPSQNLDSWGVSCWHAAWSVIDGWNAQALDLHEPVLKGLALSFLDEILHTRLALGNLPRCSRP